MALQSIDAAQCFTLISENVPTWITRVSELAQHTAARHAEFAEEYKRLAPQRPRRRRNSSVHSIQPTSLPDNEDTCAAKYGTTAAENTDNNKFRIDLKPNPLKRPNDDLSSSGSLARPPTTRMRHNLVIHYDGHTQQELEHVVRDIGTARNWIRKGKLSQLSKRSPFAFSRHMGTARPGSGIPSSRASPSRDFTESNPFEFVDKQLEVAQSLCETAAHQFLRCGNCATELQNVQEKFKSLLDVSISAASRFKQEKEQEEIPKSPASSTEIIPPLVKTELLAEGTKPAEPAVAPEIEVDDSASDGSVAIDITAFRSTRFRV